MDYYLLVQAIIVILALWLFTAYMSRTFPTLRGKRVCLVIAHPDDEAMFFSPTLRWLTRPELGNVVLVMCFSSGNAEGIGHIRKEELVKSALLLGVRTEQHIVCIESDDFQDSMTATWDAKRIASTLAKHFAPDLAKQSSTAALKTGVDAIITFDATGVSGHPNHISLYHGVQEFVRTLTQGRAGWECPVKMYTLTSTNVLRKYSSVIDSMITVLVSLLQRKERGAFPTPLLMVSGPGDYRKGQQAMTTAHVSQMRWFRWGWISISRYMITNDLVKQKVV